MKRSLPLPVFFFALVVACDTTSTAPERLAAVRTPSYNFLNGPDDLPNVVRFEAQFAFGIQDPETNLAAFAGLPANPALSTACGGGAPFAMAQFQDAGQLRDAIHSIVIGGDVNLHVYTRSTFQNFCVSVPIARGIGGLMNTDNDVFAVTSGFPGANTWGFRMNGSVELTAGGYAHLVAHNRFLIRPGDNIIVRRIYRKVDLSTP